MDVGFGPDIEWLEDVICRKSFFLVHLPCGETEYFIDNLLVRVHFIIVMIRWTGRAPWEFEFPFPGSLTSTFLA